ncbi:hypothetical protein GGR56DRAFT_2300 [Xylariaceae sp. FL0804]|nr:hypothetical protein GGR56DRAFT_2300 [Xylariaceae sp. FL0804]
MLHTVLPSPATVSHRRTAGGHACRKRGPEGRSRAARAASRACGRHHHSWQEEKKKGLPLSCPAGSPLSSELHQEAGACMRSAETRTGQRCREQTAEPGLPLWPRPELLHAVADTACNADCLIAGRLSRSTLGVGGTRLDCFRGARRRARRLSPVGRLPPLWPEAGHPPPSHCCSRPKSAKRNIALQIAGGTSSPIDWLASETAYRWESGGAQVVFRRAEGALGASRFTMSSYPLISRSVLLVADERQLPDGTLVQTRAVGR